MLILHTPEVDQPYWRQDWSGKIEMLFGCTVVTGHDHSALEFHKYPGVHCPGLATNVHFFVYRYSDKWYESIKHTWYLSNISQQCIFTKTWPTKIKSDSSICITTKRWMFFAQQLHMFSAVDGDDDILSTFAVDFCRTKYWLVIILLGHKYAFLFLAIEHRF